MNFFRIDHMKDPYEPSPLEIWRQCVLIQATWTREEEQKRRGAAQDRWRPPGCERVLRTLRSARIENQ